MWEQTVRRGTVRGQSGGSGASVRGLAAWVSSRGSEPSSAPGPMARGAKTSSEGTRSSASATSGPAEVSQPVPRVESSCALQLDPFSKHKTML